MGYEAKMDAMSDFVQEKAYELFATGEFDGEIIDRIMEGEYDSVILDRLKALLTVEKK